MTLSDGKHTITAVAYDHPIQESQVHSEVARRPIVTAAKGAVPKTFELKSIGGGIYKISVDGHPTAAYDNKVFASTAEETEWTLVDASGFAGAGPNQYVIKLDKKHCWQSPNDKTNEQIVIEEYMEGMGSPPHVPQNQRFRIVAA